MATGVEIIAAERQRQMDVEGWSASHDDNHAGAELVCAAICYAEAGSGYDLEISPSRKQEVPFLWPWEAKWWKPSDDIVRNLARAGALIAAEIDRVQRASGLSSQLEPGHTLATKRERYDGSTRQPESPAEATTLRVALVVHLRWLRWHITEPHVAANATAVAAYQQCADMLQALLTEQHPAAVPLGGSGSPLVDRLGLVVEVLLSHGACNSSDVVREAIEALRSRVSRPLYPETILELLRDVYASHREKDSHDTDWEYDSELGEFTADVPCDWCRQAKVVIAELDGAGNAENE